MTKLRTKKSLLAALKKASSRSPSYEQLEKQRLSFVMGSLPDDNRMTREEVKNVLDRKEGKKLAAG